MENANIVLFIVGFSHNIALFFLALLRIHKGSDRRTDLLVPNFNQRFERPGGV